MSKTKNETQKSVILNHLINKGTITSMEAFELYGVTRLSAIIYDFREIGYDIETIECVGKTRYGTTCTYAKYKYLGSYM